MPILEYYCDRCGVRFEKIIQSPTELNYQGYHCDCGSMADRVPSATTDDGYRFSSHDPSVTGSNYVIPARREALKNQ